MLYPFKELFYTLFYFRIFSFIKILTCTFPLFRMKHISGSALFYVFAVFFIFVWINCFKKGNISVSRFIKHSPYSLIWQIGITKKTSKSYKNSLVKGDKKGKKKKKKTVNIVANGMQTFKIMKDKGWLNIEGQRLVEYRKMCYEICKSFLS